MSTSFITSVGLFRIISILEGISFIVLLAIAMPAKYMYDNPSLIKPIGMAHGVLFLVFIAFAVFFAAKHKWKPGKTLLVLASSVLPFGTFVMDRIVLSKMKN